jgi:hypothetical protein
MEFQCIPELSMPSVFSVLLILRFFACRDEFGVASRLVRFCSELEVPEGRHNVAHRETVGARNGDVWSPVGAAQVGEHVCRPYGALLCYVTPIPPFHGGLQFVVPNGTGSKSKGNSSFSH